MSKTEATLKCTRKLHRENLTRVLLVKYYLDDEVKENGMGGACSTYWREDKHIQVLAGKSGCKNPLERTRSR
jgi:hypothetical protein